MKNFSMLTPLFIVAVCVFLIYSSHHTADIPSQLPEKLFLKNNQSTYELIPSPDAIDIRADQKQYSFSFDNHQVLVDLTVCDLNKDGNEEILTLLADSAKEYGDHFVIYSLQVDIDKLSLKEAYRNTITTIKPWMIDTCDIDGDGEPEIFIGVNKGTEYYPEQENRPFFFNFRDNMLVKKWTGSKVRHPFTQMSFADINRSGSDEMIAIEQIDEHTCVIAIYYWYGFGFTLLAESPAYEKIGSVKVIIDEGKWHIEAEVLTNKTQRTLILAPSEKRTENNIYFLEEHQLE